MPPPIAPAEVHVNSDIRNTMRALLAAHDATRMLADETPQMLAYTAGFRAAFVLLAGALNIELGEVRTWNLHCK